MRWKHFAPIIVKCRKMLCTANARMMEWQQERGIGTGTGTGSGSTLFSETGTINQRGARRHSALARRMNAYYCNYLPRGGDREKGAGHKVDLEALERHLAPSITSLAWSNKQNNKQQLLHWTVKSLARRSRRREGGEGSGSGRGGKPEREATCSCQQGGQGAGTGRG